MASSTGIGLALLLFYVAISSTTGDDYLSINHKPSYVTLDEKADSIRVSDVQHLLSAMFGFTLHTDLKFNGLYASSPFQHPTCSVALALYGGDDFVQRLKDPKLNLKTNDLYVSSNSLKHRMEHTYPGRSNVVEINHESKVGDLEGILEGMSDSKHTIQRLVTDLTPSSRLTNSTNSDITELLMQTSLILQSLTRVSRSDEKLWDIPGEADFYSYELYLPISDSEVLNEEVNSLVTALVGKVNEVMKQMYGEDYVFLILSLPESSVVLNRKSRSLLAADNAEDESAPDTSSSSAVATGDDAVQQAKAAGLAQEWTEDYPVIFHIILWLVVFMALLVIFVTHGMMSMDPGNDSIIYRMTTTRLKKE